MAADSQTTLGNNVSSLQAVKLHRLPDGSLLGIAGDSMMALRFHAWMTGDRTEKLECQDEDFMALQLFANGKLLMWDARCSPLAMPAPQCIGSGGDLAMGAILAGASPKEAVRLAAKLDIYTGGRVRCLTPRRAK